MSKDSAPFVVKAQCSLATSGPVRQILVYDESRSVMHQGDVTPEIAEEVGERSFWWAVVRNGEIVTAQPATEEDYELYDYETMNPEETKNENDTN
jgi:hypothetical protein